MSGTSQERSASWRAVDAAPDGKISYLEILTAQMAGWKRRASDMLALTPGQSVLEVGCGMGHDTQYLAGLVGADGAAVGVDFSAELVAQAQQRTAGLGLSLRFQQGDAQALAFDDNSFDAARIERTLQHLPDPALAVRELVRVVRPGGRIVVFEPDWDTVMVAGGDVGVQRAVRAYTTDFAHAHGTIGRDVPALLVAAGCTVLDADGAFFSTRSLELADTIFGLRKILEGAIARGMVSAAGGQACWDAMAERDRQGAFYGTVAGTIVLGQTG